MDTKTQQSRWQQFCASGAVQDYLAYRQEAAEENYNEILHNRADYPGTAGGGK